MAAQNQNLQTSVLSHILSQMARLIMILYQNHTRMVHVLSPLNLGLGLLIDLRMMHHLSPAPGDKSGVGAVERRGVSVLSVSEGSYHSGDNELLCVPYLRTCSIWWNDSDSPSGSVLTRNTQST